MNSVSPICSAGIAFLWLGDRLTRLQMLGLCLGVAGVVVLTGTGGHRDADETGLMTIALPFLSALGATAFYGVAANYTRRFLTGVNSLAIATGSQLSASVVLLVPGTLLWASRTTPSTSDWLSVIALGTLCTGIAYVLYFHLIARAGATCAVAVTFVIPIFGVAWGAWLLEERIDVATVAGGVIIVLGTALTTGALRARRRTTST